MGACRNFSREGNVDIFLVLFRLLTMQCKRTFTKRFTLSTQKEITPFYGISHKKFTSLAATARYIGISYKKDYLQIFQARYFFTKQIAMIFNKTTIMSLFYLTRFASITWKQELQTSVNAHPHKTDKRSVSR